MLPPGRERTRRTERETIRRTFPSNSSVPLRTARVASSSGDVKMGELIWQGHFFDHFVSSRLGFSSLLLDHVRDPPGRLADLVVDARLLLHGAPEAGAPLPFVRQLRGRGARGSSGVAGASGLAAGHPCALPRDSASAVGRASGRTRRIRIFLNAKNSIEFSLTSGTSRPGAPRTPDRDSALGLVRKCDMTRRTPIAASAVADLPAAGVGPHAFAWHHTHRREARKRALPGGNAPAIRPGRSGRGAGARPRLPGRAEQ